MPSNESYPFDWRSSMANCKWVIEEEKVMDRDNRTRYGEPGIIEEGLGCISNISFSFLISPKETIQEGLFNDPSRNMEQSQSNPTHQWVAYTYISVLDVPCISFSKRTEPFNFDAEVVPAGTLL